MSRTLRIAALVILVILALVAALPFLVPANAYKGRIEALASNALGRQVTLAGDIRFTLWPAAGFSASRVAIANAPGTGEAPLAEIEEMVVGVAVGPLLSGDLKIERLILTDPVLNLATDRRGAGNWAMGRTSAPTPATGETIPSRLQDVGLGDVRVENGALNYRDGKTGATTTLSDVNARVSLPSLDAPLAIAGSFVYRGETLALDLNAQAPRAFLNAAATPLALRVEADLLDGAFQGVYDAGPSKLDGALDLQSPSLRRLFAWLGNPLPEGGGFEAVSVKGKLVAQGSRLDFSDASIALDAIRGQGRLAIDLGEATPALKGALNLERLDVNPYLGESGAGGTAQGVSMAQGWSPEPIDLSGLRGLNAEFALTARKLVFQRMTFENSAVDVNLKNGVLTAALRELSAYGGRSAGRLTLDGSGRTPSLRTQLTVSAAQVLPFLRDAIGLTRLQGVGDIAIEVAGAGASQAAIMRNLSGRGELKIADGAIVGINLAQVARTLEGAVQGALTSAALGEGAKTDFAELSGSFVIANGVLTNDDLRLLNPFVRINGKGVIDLGAQTMNYRIEPRAVGDIEGQGGRSDRAGLGAPFRIEGPWSNLSYRPDLNPADLVNLLSGKGLQDAREGLGGLLPGLLGQPQAEPSEEETQEPDPNENAKETPKSSNPLEEILRGLPGGR